MSTSRPVYYLLGAGVLKLTGVETLVGQAYVLRWMALLWASLTVWCIWAGTRLLFGEHVALGTALVTAVYGSLF
ncbi:MAG: hypothetical protein VYE68_02250 [Acidobacteriota bacterium]|nr:hypothetical protein [Acidobacteriota bacterium]